MITYVSSDILQSPARVLVNAVNTVGVMGKGVARDFKLCFPEMFETYREQCQQGDFAIGQLMLHRTTHKWVLNFPTKEHWRSPSQIADIELGLQSFVATYSQMGITSASFPRLGCGAGGLDWDREVRPLMEAYLHRLPVATYIHEYDEDDPFFPEDRNIRTIRAWLEGDPQTVDFSKFWRDITRLLKKKSKFTTLDGERKFSVGQDKRRRGQNLVLLSDAPNPLFLSESLLVDLWIYVRSAGYAHTANLPGGLDEHADLIVALLCQLEYVRPVTLLGDDGMQRLGLHYIPPTSKHGSVEQIKVDLATS
ncbi:MAG: macro domain-containing protein [Aggregatilineales bacterium]